jgi:hypothetical protein
MTRVCVERRSLSRIFGYRNAVHMSYPIRPGKRFWGVDHAWRETTSSLSAPVAFKFVMLHCLASLPASLRGVLCFAVPSVISSKKYKRFLGGETRWFNIRNVLREDKCWHRQHRGDSTEAVHNADGEQGPPSRE